MTCKSCGCSPCTCSPAVLSGIQLVDPLITGGTIDGATLNGGVANDLSLVGATIDCTSRGCTAGVGVCNDGIATNAQVCSSIAAAVSGSNPAFCQAVEDCLSSDPTAICPAVASCIATSPGIINTNGAFGVNSRATTALYGVMRFATPNELENAACLVGIDPCTLTSFWTTPNVSSPFWTAFASAVCLAATANCGFAPLNSPAFTGIPTAPTAAPGTNTTQIATTAFVNTAINNAISGSNPAFCTAVSACLTGGGPTCASITALFPAAGGAPPAATRFLGTDCLSYTSAQIGATIGGGGGGGVMGGGCGGALTTFTGPYRGVVNPSATWVGEDNSAGAGFAQVFHMTARGCIGGPVFAEWSAISNGAAAQFRSGACSEEFGCPPGDPLAQ